MRDISMHILDIVGNSVRAGASLVTVTVLEDANKDLLELKVRDNGCGIEKEMIQEVLNPFYTTRKTRRVGLGIPLLQQNVEMSDGNLSIESILGEGTLLTASFVYSHIDRPPLGDLAETISLIVSGNPNVEFIYIHQFDREVFTFDSREVKKELMGVSVTEYEVVSFMKDMIKENLVVTRIMH